MSKHSTVTGSPELRKKAQSFKHGKTSSELKNFSDFQFSNLSSSPEHLAQGQTRRFSLESLLQHINHLLDQVYQKDRLNLKTTFNQFIEAHLSGLRGKLQQRLSLLKYLQESLQYKNYSEIEVQIQKEWRRNALMFSISTIWARVMLQGQFNIPEQFAEEYEKYRRFVANISHFYFRNSLRLLDAKDVDTMSHLYDDTAHQIINSLKDWKEIYYIKWIPLLRGRPDCDLRMDFNMKELKINPDYLCVHSEQNQLVSTTQFISMLSDECRIHEKINILKKIRATFLSEITENFLKISKNKSLKNVSQLEKDDILDCMIYCIIKGGIVTIGSSLKAMMMLIGPTSHLLSRKGVDSYRADLQSAVQYLSQAERINSTILDHQYSKMQNKIHA